VSQILTCREKDERVKLFVRGRYFSLLPRATGFGAHRAFCLSEYKRSIAVKHNSLVLVVDAACCGSTNRHRAILYKN